MRISGITYIPRKTHRFRNVFSVFLVIVFVLLIIVSAISELIAWKVIHPPKAEVQVFDSNIVPDFKDISFSDIEKKVTLKGWFFEAKDSIKAVILAHDYGSNRLQFKKQTLDMIKSLLGRGYSTLIFDFRNSGLSGGNKTSMGLNEKYDLLGAVNYVKRQGYKNVVFIGFGTGAVSAILAAGEKNSRYASTTRIIDAVVAESPYSDIKTYINDKIPAWLKIISSPISKIIFCSSKFLYSEDLSAINPEAALKNASPRPVLFIHSPRDAASADGSRELSEFYSKITGDKAVLWETTSDKYLGGYIKNHSEYMDKIFMFLTDKVYPE